MEETIKLINPRGRIIKVRPQEVTKLLSKGFMRAPEQTHEYNPVFDRQDKGFTSKTLEDIQQKKRKLLNVEII